MTISTIWRSAIAALTWWIPADTIIAYPKIAQQRGHRGGTLIAVRQDGSFALSEVIYPD